MLVCHVAHCVDCDEACGGMHCYLVLGQDGHRLLGGGTSYRCAVNTEAKNLSVPLVLIKYSSLMLWKNIHVLPGKEEFR